jgi:hypothetical protein
VKEADEFNLTVVLPEYIEPVSGNTSVYCRLENNESCYLELTARITTEARLGKNDIKLTATRGGKTEP